MTPDEFRRRYRVRLEPIKRRYGQKESGRFGSLPHKWTASCSRGRTNSCCPGETEEAALGVEVEK